MNHDRLVLRLLAYDIGTGVRALSLSDILWIGLGGGFLVAYALADSWFGLAAHAATLRGDQGLWLVRAPATIAVMSAFLGNLAAGAAARRAVAPFLRALPISLAARWRMALVATFALGLPVAVGTLVLASGAGLIVGRPAALAWGLGEAAAAGLAFAATALARLRAALGSDEVAVLAPKTATSLPFGIGFADVGRLPWVGSWAWNLRAGRVRVSFRLAGLFLLLALGAALAIGASLGRHEAAPAAVASIVGGLVVFMLTARFAPLRSPVLRTAPLTFGRAWRRLTRLPMILSAFAFAVPASAATLAEPAAVAGRVQDGLGLAVLDWSYAVFAAYFATTPLAAALSFVAAILYAIYEAAELGGGMVVAFAGLLVMLWLRARRRYIDG